MDVDAILVPLKIDLDISTNARDSFLKQQIQHAEELIGTEGAHLDPTSVSDMMLVEMYAAYLYRSRREGKTGMPRMLRWALNNRIMQEKANG